MTHKMIVKAPGHCGRELDYTISVLFGEFLGLDYQLLRAEIDHIELSCEKSECKLSLNADFFSGSRSAWLKEESLPQLPLANWCLTDEGLDIEYIGSNIPVIYGQPGLVKNKKHWHLNLDIFGSSFFMLSRYEELVLDGRDSHDRFPSTASVAQNQSFLHRPIVDEYVEILWACLMSLWPDMLRKERRSCNRISCDVDNPYSSYVNSIFSTTRKLIGDILKRRSVPAAAQTALNYTASKFHSYQHDPMNTFSWLMDVNEEAGNKIAFYFLVDQSVPEMDGHYSIHESRIRNLIRQIYDRGHEIGLHGSYGSYRNPEQLKKEVDLLRQVFDEENIEQEEIGGRQHYLRWRTSETASYLDRSGLAYDTTLGYADRPGFRCGTSHEFQMYDLLDRIPLSLRQRPLIVMECSVIDEVYMGLGAGEGALKIMRDLQVKAQLVDGDFTMLWHNSFLQDKQLRELYKSMISMKKVVA